MIMGDYMKKYYCFVLKKGPLVLLLLLITAALSMSVHFCFSALSSQSVMAQKKQPVIIIDAGHGGEDGGTVSSSGIIEKNINLSIALKLEKIFSEKGFETVMTRNEDCLIYDEDCKTLRQKKASDLHNRMKIMESYNNCLFLSVHQNHFSQSKYYGAQVFYSQNRSESEALARYIQESIVSSLQKENTRQIKPSGSEIFLLYNASQPAVMVECGFLSNPGEAQKLNSEDYQLQMAEAIYKGVSEYLIRM